MQLPIRNHPDVFLLHFFVSVFLFWLNKLSKSRSCICGEMVNLFDLLESRV